MKIELRYLLISLIYVLESRNYTYVELGNWCLLKLLLLLLLACSSSPEALGYTAATAVAVRVVGRGV